MIKTIQVIVRAFLVSFPASIFTGAVMISIALGSLFPQVESIAYPFLENNGNHIIVEKYSYSYAPGQSGTVIQHVMIDAQGNKKDITFRVGVYASLLYTLLLMVVSVVVAFVYRLLRCLPLEGVIGTTFWVSIWLAVGITSVIMFIALVFFLVFIVRALLASW
jgi:hypothetical protein